MELGKLKIEVDTPMGKEEFLQHGKKLLGIDDLANYLGLTKGTIYVWVCHKRIPYLKIGKLLKFDIAEIENWLKDKRIPVLEGR